MSDKTKTVSVRLTEQQYEDLCRAKRRREQQIERVSGAPVTLSMQAFLAGSLMLSVDRGSHADR